MISLSYICNTILLLDIVIRVHGWRSDLVLCESTSAVPRDNLDNILSREDAHIGKAKRFQQGRDTIAWGVLGDVGEAY